MMLGKARQRLGLLKVEQNNLDEAGALFTALLESPDWRPRTYASHWIQRISRLKAAKQALLSCGVDALAYAVERDIFVGQPVTQTPNLPTKMSALQTANWRTGTPPPPTSAPTSPPPCAAIPWPIW